MPRRYLVTYEYTETVQGQPREFVHETIVEAGSSEAAHARALKHFEDLARQSNVGWRRVLNRCAVAPAPRGGTDSSGRHVVREPEVDR